MGRWLTSLNWPPARPCLKKIQCRGLKLRLVSSLLCDASTHEAAHELARQLPNEATEPHRLLTRHQHQPAVGLIPRLGQSEREALSGLSHSFETER